MLIVKPYGKSVVAKNSNSRKLKRKTDGDFVDVETFVKDTPELVIAQWISAIDKIITKPKGDKKASFEQDQQRRELGEAAWKIVGVQACFQRKLAHYKKIWDWKIAPYQEVDVERQNKKQENLERLKGRWYDRFDAGSADWDAVAQKIERHLYQNAFRHKEGEHGGDEPSGFIDHRARSISKNVLKEQDVNKQIHDKSWNEYAAFGDIAAKIYEKVNPPLEEGKSPKIPRPRGVAPALFNHWQAVFGSVGFGEIEPDKHHLRDVHMAIKDYYTRTLKHTKNNDIAQYLPRDMAALREKIVQKTTNRDINALIRLGKIIHYTAGQKAGGLDSAKHLTDYFPLPDEITNSFYWGSEGQALIKRNEAFVRVWRRVLVLAARTLKDWMAPDKGNNDILSQANSLLNDYYANRHAFANSFDLKAAVLFDVKAREILFNKGDELFFSWVVITCIAQMRHASFHFKGLDDFSVFLLNLDTNISSIIKDVIENSETKEVTKNNFENMSSRVLDIYDRLEKFYEAEQKAQAESLIDTTQASHFGCFFSLSEIEAMAKGIAGAEVVALPLPKFGKILTRAADAWGYGILPKGMKDAHKTILPEPHNRAKMEGDKNPFLCQFISLKMVYDGPFREWLFARSGYELKKWLDLSIERTNAVALEFEIKRDAEYKKLLKDKNATKQQKAQKYQELKMYWGDVVVAKAAGKIKIKNDTKIIDIFRDISKLTASEMQVQRGYDSNGENAREQASYLEDVKCDLVLKAFEHYLQSVEAAQPYRQLLKKNWHVARDPVKLDGLKSKIAQSGNRAQPWQHLFYFLLHLVPVDAVNDLYHQIRKWEVLSGKVEQPETTENKTSDQPDAGAILTVMKLYLDRHDAKFTGGMQMGLSDSEKQQLAQFFDAPDTMQQIFPQDQPDVHVPIRGLREFLRFGHFNALMPILGQHKITQADVLKYWHQNKKIEIFQAVRETLHGEWVKQGREFKYAYYYATALKTVIAHRHLTAHVMLQNHVRLHHLAMAVLGRLIDYVGLWERDLYFVALAIISQKQNLPDLVDALLFKIKMKKDKQPVIDTNGHPIKEPQQAVDGVRALIKKDNDIKKDIEKYFPNFDNPTDLDPVKIRNDLAHLNMLKQGGSIDLTDWANKTRILMGYDRKLKNAVTKSLIELLAREGIVLVWDDCTKGTGPHNVINPIIAPKQAQHFNGKAFKHLTREKPKGTQMVKEAFAILEDLHGPDYQNMVAGLFGGKVIDGMESALDMIEQIDWNREEASK